MSAASPCPKTLGRQIGCRSAPPTQAAYARPVQGRNGPAGRGVPGRSQGALRRPAGRIGRAYRISARHPGRAATYTAPTEEEALEKWRELTADGAPFEITDSNGLAVDDIDPEDRIDARDDEAD
jgi:hypothetical protein